MTLPSRPLVTLLNQLHAVRGPNSGCLAFDTQPNTSRRLILRCPTSSSLTVSISPRVITLSFAETPTTTGIHMIRDMAS